MVSWNLLSRKTVGQSLVTPAVTRSSERQNRLMQYKKIWEAYFADLPDPLTVEGGINDNVKVNASRAIIDTGVYFLFGRPINFKCNPEENQGKGAAKGATSKRPGAPKAAKPPVDNKSAGAFGASKTDPKADPKTDPKADPKARTDPHTDPEADTKQGYGLKDHPADKKPFGHAPAGKPGEHSLDYGDMSQEAPTDPEWLVKLNKCWKANDKEALLGDIGLMGALTGDSFVKFVPNGAGRKRDMPRLILLDTQNVDVITDPNDVHTVLKWLIEYTLDDEETGRRKTYTQQITPVFTEDEWGNKMTTSWEIRDYEQEFLWNSGINDWLPDSNAAMQIGETKHWDYEWAPIEHCTNLRIPCMYWGMADLDESSVEVLQSIQRSMSTLNKIVRLHSSPRLFAKNCMPEQLAEIDISPENIIAIPAPDADLTVLQILDNLTSALEFTREMKSDLLEMVGVPSIALGQYDDTNSAASGINMSILYSPIIQKTERKRISYGAMLVRICLKLLELMGEEITEEMEDLCVDWPESMPGSKYLERQTLQQDQQMGVSQHTIVKKLGYNPEEELAQNNAQQEREKAMNSQYDMQINASRFGDQQDHAAKKAEQRGGNNNPGGHGGSSGGSLGAYGNSTPKTPRK